MDTPAQMLRAHYTREQAAEALSGAFSPDEVEALLVEQYDEHELPAGITHQRSIRGYFTREEMRLALSQFVSPERAEEILRESYDIVPDHSAWHLDPKILAALAELSPSLAKRVAYLRHPENPILPIVFKYWLSKRGAG